jgi:hypothetical protein
MRRVLKILLIFVLALCPVLSLYLLQENGRLRRRAYWLQHTIDADSAKSRAMADERHAAEEAVKPRVEAFWAGFRLNSGPGDTMNGIDQEARQDDIIMGLVFYDFVCGRTLDPAEPAGQLINGGAQYAAPELLEAIEQALGDTSRPAEERVEVLRIVFSLQRAYTIFMHDAIFANRERVKKELDEARCPARPDSPAPPE